MAGGFQEIHLLPLPAAQRAFAEISRVGSVHDRGRDALQAGENNLAPHFPEFSRGEVEQGDPLFAFSEEGQQNLPVRVVFPEFTSPRKRVLRFR